VVALAALPLLLFVRGNPLAGARKERAAEITMVE
jgi:hypothetical protein